MSGTILMELLGIHHIHTTVYHPCSKGLVEHLHRQLKASLTAHLPQTNWFESLHLVLLGICTALKEDIWYISAELVYGDNSAPPRAFLLTLRPQKPLTQYHVCPG